MSHHSVQIKLVGEGACVPVCHFFTGLAGDNVCCLFRLAEIHSKFYSNMCDVSLLLVAPHANRLPQFAPAPLQVSKPLDVVGGRPSVLNGVQGLYKEWRPPQGSLYEFMNR